jgi:hypothetical protein
MENAMKRLITKLAAGTMLVALPLAAMAHDDGRRFDGRGDRHAHGWKHGHKYAYYPAPVYHTRTVTRVVERPVYVPAPVYAPAPVVRAYPFPPPVNSVDIGFRIFF